MKEGTRDFPEEIVWQKICKWCAFQERSQQEVRDKLYDYGLKPSAVEDMISKLITDNFLNEERFAIAFAGGKFRQLGWGKVRIRSALKMKRVSDYCIRKALSVISDSDYHAMLEKVIEKRKKSVKEKDPFKRTYKLMSYAISRGYEPDIVHEILNQ